MRQLALILGTAWLAYAAAPDNSAGNVPVLLELFTSEGCSSCPPADELLGHFDRAQPVSGADLVVISEHVDYWDRLGWVDPHSSHLFTERQNAYAERLHSDDVYTPQLVVDGEYQLVGSDARKAGSAIRSALQSPKLPARLEATADGHTAQLQISIEAAGGSTRAEVYVALAMDQVSTRVTAGENSGRELKHTAVALSLQRIGTLDQQTFKKTLRLPLGSNAGGAATRVIVFAQDKKTGHIVAVAQKKI